MVELGAVASPIKELRSRPASAEAERCRTADRAVGGLGTADPRPPNTRVQRTRSSASPPHSPLTRYPLGGPQDRMRAPSSPFLPRAFPAWRLAGDGNEIGEVGRTGVSLLGAVVAPEEVSRAA